MRKLNGFIKRGLISITVSLVGLLYEFMFPRPLRPVSIILWVCVMFIGLLVIYSFKDSTE